MSSGGIPVELVGVRIELPTNQPIVLLKESEGQRYLPIWIGAPEATAIAFALEDVETQRPLTHDLLVDAITALGAKVARVDITELRDGVYFADLVFTRDDSETIVSSRPSDAVAVAARTSAPIFVYPGVLDEAGVELEDEDTDEEVVVERFKDFLETVSPEDFETT
jgi:bifunctional DNase/RNase